MNAAYAAWTSAGIALLALVAVIVFGVLNLRQARRGPAGTARWALEWTGKSRIELINVGTVDAHNVSVEVEGAMRTDGTMTFTVFSSGQRAAFLLVTALGMSQPTFLVRWTVDGEFKEWLSDIPGA